MPKANRPKRMIMNYTISERYKSCLGCSKGRGWKNKHIDDNCSVSLTHSPTPESSAHHTHNLNRLISACCKEKTQKVALEELSQGHAFLEQSVSFSFQDDLFILCVVTIIKST